MNAHQNSTHIVAAERLTEQAVRRRLAATRETNVIRTLLVLLSVILGVAAGVTLASAGFPWWIAFPLGLLAHLLMCGAVHCLVYGKRTGNAAMALVGGGIALISLGAFLLFASMRANWLIEQGLSAPAAWATAIGFFLFETAGPVLVGYFYAVKSDREHDARLDESFYREHLEHMEVAAVDAPGAWADAQAKLEEELLALRRTFAENERTRREVERLEARFRTLRLFHPSIRFHENTPERMGWPPSGNHSMELTATNGRR